MELQDRSFMDGCFRGGGGRARGWDRAAERILFGAAIMSCDYDQRRVTRRVAFWHKLSWKGQS